MQFPGFIGGAYQAKSLKLDNQKLVNMYVEMDEAQTGKEASPGALIGTPGRAIIQTLSAIGTIRGLWSGSNNNRVFAVCGNMLYEVTYTSGVWGTVILGTLLTNSGIVGMDDDGVKLAIVDGANLYSYTFSETYLTAIPWAANTAYSLGDIVVPVAGSYQYVVTQAGNSAATQPAFPSGRYATVADGTVVWTRTSTFAQCTDPGFLGSNYVRYQDEIFLFAEPLTNTLYSSNIAGQPSSTVNPPLNFSEITFNGINFVDLGASAEPIQNFISLLRTVYVMTTKTFEIYQDTGQSPGIPYTRIPGGFAETGCIAPNSLLKTANAIFWLGQDNAGAGIVFTASSFQPQRVSTFAVEKAIQSYSTMTDAIAYTYQEDGHQFYVLSFPTANKTWVFDISTQIWHERSYYINGTHNMQPTVFHVYSYGVHITGDFTNGNIYQSSQIYKTDAGTPIIRRRMTPHASSGIKRLFWSWLQLDMQVGVGLDGIQQGTDPIVMMRYSNDGGLTWSREKVAEFGKIGQTKKRAIFRRLGMGRDRVYDITISDPVFVGIIDCEIEFEKGVS